MNHGNIYHRLKTHSFPELSYFEKKVRRVELLMLENAAGFYKSHLQTFAHVGPEEIDQILANIDAKELGGFWVHPHYFFNVRISGNSQYPRRPESSITIASIKNVMGMIKENPQVSIRHLMYVSKLQNPQDLIELLRGQVTPVQCLQDQRLASEYLYRRFNIRTTALQ